VVHGRHSAEHYRDYKNPDKFEGVLEKVYDRDDNAVYRVPFTAPNLQWLDTNRLRVGPGLASVKVTYEEGWHAFSRGREIAIEKDELGFIRVPGASGPVDMVYTGVMEQKICAVVSLLTWTVMLGLLWKNRA
jgi:hypothetical protein